ncbi:hypothetical protein MKW92_016726, partial [Papaver armeniacum]
VLHIRYQLVAAIIHLGNESTRGHYTTDKRGSDGKWWRCLDESVTDVSENKVLLGDTYLLFYLQIQ